MCAEDATMKSRVIKIVLPILPGRTARNPYRKPGGFVLRGCVAGVELAYRPLAGSGPIGCGPGFMFSSGRYKLWTAHGAVVPMSTEVRTCAHVR